MAKILKGDVIIHDGTRNANFPKIQWGVYKLQ